MKRIVRLYLYLIFSLLPLNIVAQSGMLESDVLQSILTDIAAQNEEDQDMEQLMEMLEDLAENPVHVNDATHDDLARIGWLTEFQINSILDHVKRNGAITSYYEIAYLYGFTPELAQILIPFISLEQKPKQSVKPRNVVRYGKSRLLIGGQTTLTRPKGYLLPDSVKNRFLGSPVKTYFKYSFSYSDRFYLGFSAEKDAGEEFFRGNNPYGYDFYSFHLQINPKGHIKTITLGDFRADFGQGLVMWSGMNYGKSAMIMNSMRYNSGLRKYSSLEENKFLRGAGTTIQINPMEISIFYSNKAIDATISERDPDNQTVAFSSFGTSGYHRTPNEQAQKDAVKEQIAGTNVSITRPNLHVGATAVYYEYDAAYVPNAYIYNHFAFSGKSNANYSVDFRFRLGDAIFFGEQALSHNRATGMIYGLQLFVSEHLTANILYRNYAKDFHALYGRALGENSANTNEEGFYVGWNWNTGGNWKFSSYLDIFRFPWLRYRTDAPSLGREAMLQADYAPSPQTKIYIQTRYKEKEENATEPISSTITDVHTMAGKIVFSHQIADGCGIGNHVEIKEYKKEGAKSNGYYIAQDVYATINTFRRFPLRVTFRYALFDTDDYNSRIYSYENDMLYAFSIPSFYDQGMRIYLLLTYSLGKHIALRCKYATTYYPDRESISSGLNEIQGNKYREMKIQLSYKF